MRCLSILKIVTVGRNPKSTLTRTIFLGIFCFFLFRYVLIPIKVYGKSMEPAYRNGSINFVNTLCYLFHEPQRGDVVAIAMTGTRVMLLKRIIGLPGETVAFLDGTLFINGRRFPEPYIKTDYQWTRDEVKNDGGEYFVAGDNRSVPISVHSLGRVKRRKIVGRVLF